MKHKIINFYYRITQCRKRGHLYLQLPSMPDCERIYTAEALDRHYKCLFCNKEVNQWEVIGMLVENK